VLWVAMTLGVIRIPVSVSMRVRSSRLPNESRPWSESPSPKAEQTIALIGSPGQGAYRNIIWHTGKLRHAQAGERLGGGRDAPRRAVGRIGGRCVGHVRRGYGPQNCRQPAFAQPLHAIHVKSLSRTQSSR
jgi:hypothetical protein